jgi:hypothetical protein
MLEKSRQEHNDAGGNYFVKEFYLTKIEYNKAFSSEELHNIKIISI